MTLDMPYKTPDGVICMRFIWWPFKSITTASDILQAKPTRARPHPAHSSSLVFHFSSASPPQLFQPLSLPSLGLLWAQSPSPSAASPGCTVHISPLLHTWPTACVISFLCMFHSFASLNSSSQTHLVIWSRQPPPPYLQ